MLDIDDFRTMLDQVSPHIGTDDSTPALCGVRMEASNRGLLLVATDRFTLAMSRNPEPSTHPWATFLTAADVKAYKALAVASRTRAARIGMVEGALMISVGEHAMALPDRSGLAADFPGWRRIVRDAVEAAPNLTAPITLAPRLLARWHTHIPAWRTTHRGLTGTVPAGPDRGGALTVWSGGPNKPIVVARGDHFLGVQMPMRHGDDHAGPVANVRDAWQHALTEPSPSSTIADAA
ncbi:hypothetical protein GCM10023205_52540 [Yinghuangia aomiensis]|uniref:DNA polymerase III beta sliding clamp central domain-containing protein n=1 Tax=Yinghuangia aomiensis TaxID=676205 RepID=A0ABP9HU26_9ACTN